MNQGLQDMNNRKLTIAILVSFLFVLGAGPLGALVDPPDHGSYAYPNPVKGCCVNVVYRMEEPGTVEIRVYQEAGNLVNRVEEWKDAGVRVSRVACRQAPGYYFYRVTLRYDSGRTDVLSTGEFVVVKS
jgi:hypothetical protein